MSRKTVGSLLERWKKRAQVESIVMILIALFLYIFVPGGFWNYVATLLVGGFLTINYAVLRDHLLGTPIEKDTDDGES